MQPSLVLACKGCGWRPPTDSTMEEFDLHYRLEHEGTELVMDLVAVCTCDSTMAFLASRPTGGGHKDWFKCPSCGDEGFVRRNN